MNSHALGTYARPGLRLAVAAGAGALVAATATPAATAPHETQLVHEALPLLCADAPERALAQAFADATLAPRQVVERGELLLGWRQRLQLADGRVLELERIAPQARLRRASVTVHDLHARPQLLVIAGEQCGIRAARAIEYDDDAEEHVLRLLDAQLRATARTEALNPRVPTGADPGGVTVALVDAGVNYLLPEIAGRLARDAVGTSLGQDYWDLDARPFDANPARSPFFPQRHGTRTASVLLREAPAARLLPYRYPRPDMSRMRELVRHAAVVGARIMNLSLGGNQRGEWDAFAQAAREHPDILFVVSAGNNGRDLDREPVFPAALQLPNLLTVTSSDVDGYPAAGANWGLRSVDLLVPGEAQAALDFDGSARRVSGSSYAAARVSALAARLLAASPQLSTEQLRGALLARALPPPEPLVRHGWIPDPLTADRMRDGGLAVLADIELDGPHSSTESGSRFAPTLLVLTESGWTRARALALIGQASEIVASCGITVAPARVLEVTVPPVLRDFHPGHARALLRLTPATTPLVAFVRDTVDRPAFDGVTFGTGNSRTRPWLRFSVWITAGTAHPPVALAHELAHLLMDNGTHTDRAGNLMLPETSPASTALDDAQCQQMREQAAANGLLR